MKETRIAKLFKNGSSQAVRLPAEFRFESDEVTRDEATGGVLLSSRPSTKTWDDFFEFVQFIDVPGDFMADRPLNVRPKEQGVFDDAVRS